LTNTDEIESVRIFDTTLRDGEQSPRTSFDYNDKRAIAELLDEMGTHVIEAGFPVNSEPEFEAVSDIAAATDATTCGLARVVEKDVEAAIDAGVDMVHVFVSTSDVQLQDSMHASREEAVDRAVASVEQVREAGPGSYVLADGRNPNQRVVPRRGRRGRQRGRRRLDQHPRYLWRRHAISVCEANQSRR